MNEEFLKTYQCNVGTITFIEVRRQQRPPGLRKPYEYILPRKAAEDGYDKMRLFLKGQPKGKFQYASCYKKGVSRGMKIDVFILGFTFDFCGDGRGLTEDEWKRVTGETQGRLFYMLGQDARMYIEPFSTEAKFQARFETYVAYDELLP